MYDKISVAKYAKSTKGKLARQRVDKKRSRRRLVERLVYIGNHS